MMPTLFFGLFISFGACVSTLEIELFDNTNFQDYDMTLRNTSGCTNLTEDWTNFMQEVRSMKTDTCILLYKQAGCTSYSYRLEPGQYHEMALVIHETVNFIGAGSYNLCTSRDLTATATLNVDIVGTAFLLGSADAPYNGFLHRYRDVCSCTNLSVRSEYIGKVTQIENFHNCVILYEEGDCQGRSLKLLGGYSPQSWPVPDDYSFIIPSTSIAPCQIVPTCHSLKVEIHKFSLISKISSEGIKAFSENVTVGTTTKLRNNGTVTVSQLYKASETIEESVEVTRIPGFSRPSATFATTKHVTFEVSGNSIWNLKKVKRAITEAYQTSSDASANDDTFTISENREVNVEQKIEFWPCSEYVVSSHITVVQNLPLEYEFYSTMSGLTRGKTLTAAELKERLVDGLVYVQDVYDNTIMAKGRGTILIDFGLDVETDGSGQQINDCPLPTGFCSRDFPSLCQKHGNV